jgi:hypothetical protein
MVSQEADRGHVDGANLFVKTSNGLATGFTPVDRQC